MARARSSKGQEIDPIAIVLFGIFFACYLIYQWIQSNWSTIVFTFEILIAVVVGCGILYLFYYIMTDKKRQQEKEEARKKTEETARLWRIQDLNAEKAPRIEREERLRKEAEFRATLFGQVIDTIEKFQPTKVWGNEDSYHKELQGFLRAFSQIQNLNYRLGRLVPISLSRILQ